MVKTKFTVQYVNFLCEYLNESLSDNGGKVTPAAFREAEEIWDDMQSELEDSYDDDYDYGAEDLLSDNEEEEEF